MRWRSRVCVPALVAALLALPVAAFAAAGPSIPAVPPNYVVDLAGVVEDGAETRVNALLRDLEARTTAQIVVLTLPSLEGESLEEFSVDVAHNRWKLGQKGKDNGVLITLALQERKYRIEVGYGLEAVLPDSLVGGLGREVLLPAFRAGDFGGGLAALAGELATRVATASGPGGLPGAPQAAARRQPAGREKPGPLATVLGLLLMAGFLWLLIRHPQLLIWLMLSSRGGSRGSWGDGGGFGFGGGGGGGFGGGGSSGSW